MIWKLVRHLIRAALALAALAFAGAAAVRWLAADAAEDINNPFPRRHGHQHR